MGKSDAKRRMIGPFARLAALTAAAIKANITPCFRRRAARRVDYMQLFVIGTRNGAQVPVAHL
jgi:hypothetical protein